MSGVALRAEGDFADIDNVLGGLIDFGENPFEFLDEIGGELVTSTQFRFDDGQAPDGTPWKTSQRAEATGGKTLKKSGLLADSITHDATQQYVEWGTDNEVYAAIHQFGGETGSISRKARFEMPARPYLGLNAEDEKMIEDVAFEFISDAVGL